MEITWEESNNGDWIGYDVETERVICIVTKIKGAPVAMYGLTTFENTYMTESAAKEAAEMYAEEQTAEEEAPPFSVRLAGILATIGEALIRSEYPGADESDFDAAKANASTTPASKA